MARPVRIALTAPLPEPAVEALRVAGEVTVPPGGSGHLGPAELHRHVTGASAIVCPFYDAIDARLMDAAGPQLQVVANVAVGYDNVDLEAARQRGIVVTNTPGVLTAATADLAIALILALTRRLGEAERLLRRREPWSWELDFMLGTSVAGKTLGIVGLGAIGRATAARARAFGMDILYAARRPAEPAVASELEAQRCELDELLGQSDVVSLHCPLTPDTHHLIDAGALARMRGDSYLINTARGPIVDEGALVAALRRGEIAGAGLDVFEHEPAVAAGLIDRDDVVLLPHIGSATREVRLAMAILATDNVLAVLRGDPPPTPLT